MVLLKNIITTFRPKGMYERAYHVAAMTSITSNAITIPTFCFCRQYSQIGVKCKYHWIVIVVNRHRHRHRQRRRQRQRHGLRISICLIMKDYMNCHQKSSKHFLSGLIRLLANSNNFINIKSRCCGKVQEGQRRSKKVKDGGGGHFGRNLPLLQLRRQ